MSGVTILPDQVYGEESFEVPSSRRSGRGRGGIGGGETRMFEASGQSYEDDDFGTSASLSGCSSSGYEIHEEEDECCLEYGSLDRYGREMRSLLKGLEDALDKSDFTAGGLRPASDQDRRRRKRVDRLIRPEFFCQYPRLLAAASMATPPSEPHRSTSVDRALVLPMHRAAGGGAGRASKWRIRHRSAGGGDVAAASGVPRPAAGRRHKRTTSREDGRRERRSHIKSGKALCVFHGALRFEMPCTD